MRMLQYAALLATGALAKATDESHKRWSYVFGAAFGALGAWVVVNYPILAPLGIGLVLGQLLAGKIDTPAHGLATAAFFFPIVAMGIASMDAVMLTVFSLAALVDELAHERVRHWFFENRLTVEVAAFCVFAFTNVWEPLAGILCFDAGYLVLAHALKATARRPAGTRASHHRIR